jgi:O-antigen ligase
MIIGVTIVGFAPFLIDNSNAMMHKRNGLEITTQNTSRDALWAERIAEFESSPIIGIGFAAHGVGANKVVGRNESGGSFISVLAQAGIIGIIFIALIWAAAIITPSRIGDDPNLILIYAGFVFFSIHCIIEGYMFQAGWYLCLIIWLIIGVMIEHKLYGDIEEENILEEEDLT